MKYLLLMACTAFVISKTTAQLGNVWCFGYGATVDFNSGTPVGVAGAAIYASEGSTSIDDNSGNLLFYTNGSTVNNRNHVLMPNGSGLFGDDNSAQSAVIVPGPGNTGLYYIFTMRNWTTGGPGVHYSIVDMSLDGGLGDVTTKNVLVNDSARESLSATKHCNGVDYWVTFFDKSVNAFHTYLLTSAGLSSTPVVSNVGSMITTNNRFGYLKFSPNGQRLAYALGDGASIPSATTLELYDFNPSTGIVSNPQILSTVSTSSYSIYDCEFSPNSNILYLSGFVNKYIYQFDLLAGNTMQIIASQTDIASAFPASTKASLQLGPDGKIYVGLSFESRLGAIQNPNAIGLSCNYTDNAVDFSSIGVCGLGLPNFISSTFSSSGSAVSLNMCAGDSVLLPWGGYADSAGTYIDTLTSVFGCDSLIYANVQISQFQSQNQLYQGCIGDSVFVPQLGYVDSALTYIDTISGGAGCDTLLTIQVTFDAIQSFSTLNICSGDSVYINGSGYVHMGGTYVDTLISIQGCDSIATTSVSIQESYITSTQSLNICLGDSIYIPGYGYVNTSGTYQDTVINNFGCDTLLIFNVNTLPYFPKNQNIPICNGETIFIPGIGTVGAGTYIDTIPSVSSCDTIVTYQVTELSFSSNQNGSISCIGAAYALPGGGIIHAPGVYHDTLVSAMGCDSIIVTTVGISSANAPYANFELNNPEGGVAPIEIQFDNGSINANYYWWDFGDGQTSSEINPSHTYTDSAYYTIMLIATNDSVCFDTAIFEVLITENFNIQVPNVFTPNGDGKNDSFTLKLDGTKSILVEIYNRWGLKIYEWKNIGGSWNGETVNEGKAPSGTYYYVVNGVDIKNKKFKRSGYFSLLR